MKTFKLEMTEEKIKEFQAWLEKAGPCDISCDVVPSSTIDESSSELRIRIFPLSVIERMRNHVPGSEWDTVWYFRLYGNEPKGSVGQVCSGGVLPPMESEG